MGEREEFIKGLRELADFYEQNEQLNPVHDLKVDLYAFDRNDFLKYIKLFGTVDKDFGTSYASITKRFSGNVGLRVFTDREKVCKRVIKEVVEVPEEVVPAHQREVVEWECEESWLGGE